MRICIFIDGTFIPERDGASTRFAYLPRSLVAAGGGLIVFHCLRGWSNLHKISQEPYSTYYFSPQTYYFDHKLLVEILRRERIDIIQFNDAESVLSLGKALTSSLEVRVVYEAHYHTSTLAEQLGLNTVSIESLKQLEREACSYADELIVFTENDKDRWIHLSGSDARRTSIIPFGISGKTVQPRARQKPKLVFLGNMYFEPNERAVERIVKEILPAVRTFRPDVNAVIIGDMPEHVRKYCDGHDIELIGEVPDAKTWISECSVGLAPISEGSGVRTKILEYLSCGIPVVSSTAAAEGLDFPALFVCDDFQQYIRICVDLLNGQLSRLSRANETIAILNKNHLWETVAVEAKSVYQKIRATPLRKRSNVASVHNGLPLWLEEVFKKKRFSETSIIEPSDFRYGKADNGKSETF